MSESQEEKRLKRTSLFCAVGSETTTISQHELKQRVVEFLDTLGSREDILLLPPDYTRFHSQAGIITQFIAEYYNYSEGIRIMPALGTHAPMTSSQLQAMFGSKLSSQQPSPFMVHDWRNDVVTIGHVPSQMVKDATHGMVDEPWPAQLNKYVWEKRLSNHDNSDCKPLVLSIGQVVPHEVTGMANYNKNVFVGVGGVEAINLSHFIGAVHGMEQMMGRSVNPLRAILNHASKQYLEQEFDLWYILTVMGTCEATGEIEMRGLYIGNDIDCYNRACDLSLKVNFTLLEKPPSKMVVHLDPDEFHSTWLGNKAIYRTRMAIADDGELLILAPGVQKFGEDSVVDQLIRKYGYVGTPIIMKAMKEHEELQENLSAVAHLIHGSTEGRFRVTYCPGKLTKEEVESVGFRYGDLEEMTERYSNCKDGWCFEEAEDGSKSEFYYISNPALGLWAVKSRFESEGDETAGEAHEATTAPTSDSTSLLSTKQAPTSDSAGVGGWAKPPT